MAKIWTDMGMIKGFTRVAAGGGFLAAFFFGAVQAQAEPQLSVDISGKVGYATNPFLEYEALNLDTDVVTATISVSPQILFPGETGNFRLSGNFQHTEYSRQYRSKQSYSVSAGWDQRLSERFSMRAGANLDSAVIGSDQIFAAPIDGGAGVDPDQPPVVDDITLLGSRQRRLSIRTMVGMSYQPSARDRISLDLSAAFTRYPNPTTFDEYNQYTSHLGYSREVAAETFVGVTVGVSRSNYLGTPEDDGTVITPQLTASAKVDQRWTISGTLGASIARINDVVGEVRQTSLAGSFGACRKDERSNFCFTANRSALPSSFGGIRTQTGVGSSFGYRLGERTDISASANYSWADQSILGTANSVEYFTATMTLNRRLSERVSGFISDGYSDSYGGTFPREANIQVNAGIRVTLGDRR